MSGFSFLTTTFDVTEPPIKDNIIWRMTVDGIQLKKIEKYFLHLTTLNLYCLNTQYCFFNSTQTMKKILIVIMCLSLSACDIILDQLLDCIDQDSPQFSPNQFPVATLNQFYSYTISASINNNPFDSSYDYTIYLTGNLPAGLSVKHDFNDRTIIISGTPTATGISNFSLHVTVEDPNADSYQTTNVYDDGDTLCDTNHTQNYSISVVM